MAADGPVRSRGDLLTTVAAIAVGVDPGHPTRVAVEGITASGKSTFARELAASVRAAGRPCTVMTMDGWHHPAAHRHRQGRRSSDGYYEDAYDLEALRDEVLVPLGPNGISPRSFRPAIIDLATDTPVDPPRVEVAEDAVLVVDGSFLSQPSVAGHWDLSIWLDVPFEVAQARGVARDADLLGGADAAAVAFEQRYHAAFRRYLREVDPVTSADVVVEHTDPQRPRLLRPAMG